MESLAGTTSLQALAIGFGLETDPHAQREGDGPDGDHQAGGNPTTPELNSPVDRIALRQHLGEKTLLKGNQNRCEQFFWAAGGWRATGQQLQGFTTKSPK